MDATGKTYLSFDYQFHSIIMYYAVHYWSSHFRSGTGRSIRDKLEKGSSAHQWSTGDGVTEEETFNLWEAERTRLDSKFCFGGTREGALKTIEDWATRADDDGKCVFWLYGEMNVGRPTIATTIAKWAREEKQTLGGCFFPTTSFVFVSLEAEDCIFPTLASQLAQFDPRCKHALYDILKEAGDDDFKSMSFQSQFDSLVRQPLSECPNERSILIVLGDVDGLRHADLFEVLQILLQFNALGSDWGGPKFRILITSGLADVSKFLVLNTRRHQTPPQHHNRMILMRT